MSLRVTPQVVMDQAIFSAQRQTAALAVLQQQAATGNRILQPSDDPLAAVSVMANKAQDQRLDSYLSNIQDARATMNVGNSALLEANNIITQARQVAIEGSHGTNDNNSFEALAQEIDAILNRLINIANTQNNGRYVFGGTATNKAPFTVANRDSLGRPTSVVYNGSADRVSVNISQQQTVETLYDGSAIFQKRTRGTTLYVGLTGAAAGTGTDTGVGQGTLIGGRTVTSYAPGSGVQAGTNSASGDTIQFPPGGANSLTIVDSSGTGASGTIALNGGTPVAFTNAGTNLQVTGPKGETVFVNTTAITPAFNGTVAATANGTLSTDGGLTTVPINFTANQVVTNSQTGAITNVNSQNITRTGSADLNYAGTLDAFQALMALRDDLRNARGLTAAQQAQSISNRLTDLDHASNGILQAVGEQSASLQNLDAMETRLKGVQLDTKKLIGEQEGADISQVVIGLSQQQNLLQLTLAASAKIFSQNLLDYLR